MPRRPPSKPSTDDQIARTVVDRVAAADYRPVPLRTLLHDLHVEGPDRATWRRVIRRLLDDGRLSKIGGGRLVVDAPPATRDGRLQLHRDGFGFVLAEDGGEDLFVPARRLGHALGGDRVRARVIGTDREGRIHGEVVSVLDAHGRSVLGLYEASGGGGVRPFDSGQGDRVDIEAGPVGVHDGDAVCVEILGRPGPGRSATGRIVENLGALDAPGTDIAVVIRKYDLAETYPAEAAAQADALPRRVRRSDREGRERFDDPAPVTIDGETAQDFDDAIAVAETARGFRLWVHIADVAHFVPPDSLLDMAARERGTSVYFPGRVVPMFPERLSNDLCSLRPRCERLVQSAILDISRTGRVTHVRFADGVIRSAARLTYVGVAAALEGRRVREVPQAVVPMLQTADRLRRILERRRRERGSIDFDLPEPQILLDVEGAITGVTIEPRNAAHEMIEEFMLAANEAVAGWLTEQDSPCLYRIHEPPDPLKLQALGAFVHQFDLELERTSPRAAGAAIRDVLAAAESRAEYPIIAQVALRTMQQARYSPDNVGHFGLAAPVYAHFTSPIRRYPDLIVHRLLRARRGGTAPSLPDAGLDAVAVELSRLERAAEAAEREVLQWKKVAFLADKVGESFAAVITGVTRFGLFCQLTENLAEGLVHVERLGPERYEFDAGRLELLGARSGRTFRLGDRLRVRVVRVDRALQRVDLEPTEPAHDRPHPVAVAEPERQRRAAEQRGQRRTRRRRGSRQK